MNMPAASNQAEKSAHVSRQRIGDVRHQRAAKTGDGKRHQYPQSWVAGDPRCGPGVIDIHRVNPAAESRHGDKRPTRVRVASISCIQRQPAQEWHCWLGEGRFGACLLTDTN
jgi:hypothetical protein